MLLHNYACFMHVCFVAPSESVRAGPLLLHLRGWHSTRAGSGQGSVQQL